MVRLGMFAESQRDEVVTKSMRKLERAYGRLDGPGAAAGRQYLAGLRFQRAVLLGRLPRGTSVRPSFLFWFASINSSSLDLPTSFSQTPSSSRIIAMPFYIKLSANGAEAFVTRPHLHLVQHVQRRFSETR